MNTTRRVRIEGRVQGVAYRDWTQRTALSLGLRGWVRNRRDGSVEACFSGTEATVEDMLVRCRQGPRAAEVTRIEPLDPDGDIPADFEIRPTV